MKIIFFSDIHGIYENLNLIEKVIDKKKINQVVVLGDLYYPGPNYNGTKEVNSSKVKDFLTRYSEKLICMRGNCDSDVDIKASDFPICSGLSLICVDGLNIYITHGNEYSMKNNRKFNGEGILIYGHEHIASINKDHKMTYINVGSISLPKDDKLPTYLIYENKSFVIYDINENIIDKIKF